MEEYKPSDIFHLMNRADASKKELDFELYIFSKNMVPYKLNMGTVQEVLRHQFLYESINFVTNGLATGLEIVPYLEYRGEENSLPYLEVSEAPRLDTLAHIITNDNTSIVSFNSAEHVLKNMAGVIARIWIDKKTPFFVIKKFDAKSALDDQTDRAADYLLNGSTLDSFKSNAGFKLQDSSVVVLHERTAFVFDRSKFEAIFKLNPAIKAQAKKSAAMIHAAFNIATNLTVNDISLIADTSAALQKKLAGITSINYNADQVLEIADNYQLDLMMADTGALIISEEKELKTFLDILADNYLKAESGVAYYASTKKVVEQDEE